MKKNFRHIIQVIFTAVTNGYILGFAKGKIFQGNTKYACVPGLNCYSCPGAVGSCPIGSLQNALAGSKKSIPYYVVGFLILFGVLFGRLICGFLCPFGLLQDLLYKIKSPKLKVPKKIDKPLRMLKYVILALFVVIFPLFLVNEFGLGSPTFCKWICPSGTFFGAIPLLSMNEGLRSAIGGLFSFKMLILIATLVLSVLVYRPFCKYICPLGAFYGFFNKFSLYSLDVDMKKCTNCKACEKKCKMQVEITKNINSAECIRCGDCISACPHGCISSNLKKNK